MKQIPKEQVLTRIRFENPWWDTYEVQKRHARLTPRPYLGLFLPLVASSTVHRAVVLMGPRRVGKTVLLHHTAQALLKEGVYPTHIAYLSVDNPLYNGLSLEQMLTSIQEASQVDYRREDAFVFFDEIQYLKEWEVHLKQLVDDYPRLQVVASGSAAAALRLKSAESGAGRLTDFLLPPLTFYEFLELLGKSHLMAEETEDDDFVPRAVDIEALNAQFLDYLNFGGYPEVVFSEEIRSDPGRFVKADIIDKVLLRDLPSLYGIQDIQELNSLFTSLAFNTAQEVSLQELSMNSGVAKPTIARYIEYLEAAFLIRRVDRVDRTGRRFKRRNFFKVYLTNPSMRCALFAPASQDDPSIGALVETAVFAQWFHHVSEDPLRYARWRNGEVDLVSLGGGWAGELKWSDTAIERGSALKNLTDFCRTNKVMSALVTTKTRRGERSLGGLPVQYLPASEYCYALGRNIIQGRLSAFHGGPA